jgi:FkbM family methyltransferase
VALFPIASVLPYLPRLKIVDIGASESEQPPAYMGLLRAFSCELVGFEPDAAEYEKLNRHSRPGHQYLPYAIGDGSRRTLYQCSSAYCSSLFEPDEVVANKFHTLGPLMHVTGRSEVDTHRLDDIAETAGADFLKIDVQGAELLVLEGAAKRLNDILIVHTEVEFLPLYKGQPLFPDIDACLRRHGFLFHTLVPFGRTFRPLIINNNDEAWMRQMIWADAVYVRDFTKFAGLAPEALLKIAAILHENYQSFDLAALALDAYDKQTGSGLQAKYLRRLSAG